MNFSLIGTCVRAAVATAVATAVAMAAASAAQAADLGTSCCADLEERIAELEATAARKGNRKVSLAIAGLVNETLMAWDDGFEQNTYIVTNETKRSRVSFSGNAKVTDDLSAGFVVEIGVRGDRQDRKDQDNASSGNNLVDARYIYWYGKSKSLGQVAVGLQPEAYDTITEITLANTNHFARPAPTQQIGDGGRGYFLRLRDGTLTSLRYGNIVTQGFNGTPGEGHRLNVVRYDTPAMFGFILSTSWGEDDVWDAALRYAGEFAGFKMAAGVGFGDFTKGTPDIRGCALGASSPDIDCQELGSSASVMHLESGLFVTGAYGHRWDENVNELYAGASNVQDTQSFWSVQAGIEESWLPLGKTTIFGEYWIEHAGPGLTTTGTRLDATPLGAGPFISSADIEMWGIGANQQLAAGVDVYISYRHVEADVATSADGGRTGSTTTPIEPFQYVTAGAAIKF